ncbi:hypothetical protein X731_07420 [Mesorhizobium sp. L2C054A000]|nr:hypothetical protein X731_07420 [Mesorhizobium sp. L2C054A000]
MLRLISRRLGRSRPAHGPVALTAVHTAVETDHPTQGSKTVPDRNTEQSVLALLKSPISLLKTLKACAKDASTSAE